MFLPSFTDGNYTQGFAIIGSPAKGLTIGTNKFTVEYTGGTTSAKRTNAGGQLYNYIAFK
ncbi:hypothetical protein D3C78_1885640 [compost metagenome]